MNVFITMVALLSSFLFKGPETELRLRIKSAEARVQDLQESEPPCGDEWPKLPIEFRPAIKNPAEIEVDERLCRLVAYVDYVEGLVEILEDTYDRLAEECCDGDEWCGECVDEIIDHLEQQAVKLYREYLRAAHDCVKVD